MKKMENGKWKIENSFVSVKSNKFDKYYFSIPLIFAFCLLPFAFSFASAQIELPPAPSAPKAVSVPAVKEKKLPNGLTVAVAERKNVPLVTVQLLVRSGASSENLDKAGLANMTADLLTKGTKTRTATQIAEQMEFLGGTIETGADWNKSVVTINVMSDKLEQALAIMADVVLNPAFKQDEIDLLKSQTLDGLNYNLKQPGFLSNYVASKYSFNEHPAGGTPESIKNISRTDVIDFKKEYYESFSSVLIFTGNISPVRANTLAQKFFGKLGKPADISKDEIIERIEESPKVPSTSKTTEKTALIKRILVVDLANSGQTSVSYTANVNYGRGFNDEKVGYDIDPNYFPALVLNSILGGGYSSRLNQEIRIKRGLSYGAGSSFAWRWEKTDFATRTQTKDISAAEVAELVLAEVKKLGESSATAGELVSRKSVLTGNFGRNLETNEGLAAAIADLYNFDLPTSELNSYTKNVQSVTDAQIRDFAGSNLIGGDIIIVGDYAKFKDDLAKRFPNMKIDVIKADELDLSKENLRK
jgi:zinc protease